MLQTSNLKMSVFFFLKHSFLVIHRAKFQWITKWSGFVCFSGDSGAFSGGNWLCHQGKWWLAPACRADATTCIPLLTHLFWGWSEMRQKAAAFNLPIAMASTPSDEIYKQWPRDNKMLAPWLWLFLFVVNAFQDVKICSKNARKKQTHTIVTIDTFQVQEENTQQHDKSKKHTFYHRVVGLKLCPKKGLLVDARRPFQSWRGRANVLSGLQPRAVGGGWPNHDGRIGAVVFLLQTGNWLGSTESVLADAKYVSWMVKLFLYLWLFMYTVHMFLWTIVLFFVVFSWYIGFGWHQQIVLGHSSMTTWLTCWAMWLLRDNKEPQRFVVSLLGTKWLDTLLDRTFKDF